MSIDVGTPTSYTVWLEKERAKARERLWKKEKEYEKERVKSGREVQRTAHRLTATLARMTPMNPTRNAGAKAQDRPVSAPRPAPAAVNLVSKYLAELTPKSRVLISQLALDIKMEHPDWSREKIYEEAKRLLPGVYRSPKSVPT